MNLLISVFCVVMFSHSKIKHCIHFVLKKTHCKIRTKTKISPSFEVLYETEGIEVVAHLCLFARGTFCFLGWCLSMTTFVGWWFQILLPFPRDGLRFKHPVRDFLKQLAQRPTSHMFCRGIVDGRNLMKIFGKYNRPTISI